METSHEWDKRKNIRTLLKDLPTKFIGTNFLVLVTTSLMQSIMEIARDLRMVDTFSQWLYVVSDTNFLQNNISSVLPLIEEGNNIAFIYNLTKTGSDCVVHILNSIYLKIMNSALTLFLNLQTGIKCHANEILQAFVLGLSRTIKEEKAIYGQISDEEWEVIRMTKRDKRDAMLTSMFSLLIKTSKCDNCSTWSIESGEIWGNHYPETTSFSDDSVALTTSKKIEKDFGKIKKLLLVGYWKQNYGLHLSDALFPHISHGFRGKNFHIISYHVTYLQ